jgi:hypothetical protein
MIPLIHGFLWHLESKKERKKEAKETKEVKEDEQSWKKKENPNSHHKKTILAQPKAKRELFIL